MIKSGLLLFPLGLSILAGVLVSLQAGYNPQLGRLLGHPLWAAFLSFVIGTLGLVAVMIALRVPVPAFSLTVSQAPWYLWLGGLFGAFYVTTAILYAPQLGGAVFMGAVVVGQMVASLLLDHYALAGFAERPMSPWRVGGAALLVVGLMMMQLAPDVQRTAPVAAPAPLPSERDTP